MDEEKERLFFPSTSANRRQDNVVSGRWCNSSKRKEFPSDLLKRKLDILSACAIVSVLPPSPTFSPPLLFFVSLDDSAEILQMKIDALPRHCLSFLLIWNENWKMPPAQEKKKKKQKRERGEQKNVWRQFSLLNANAEFLFLMHFVTVREESKRHEFFLPSQIRASLFALNAFD